MLAGLKGLEEVAARWEEGIGRNSHTLELQELGGFSLARTRVIYECLLFQGMGFHKSSPITNLAKAICVSLFAGKKTPAAGEKSSPRLVHVTQIPVTLFLPKTSACCT